MEPETQRERGAKEGKGEDRKGSSARARDHLGQEERETKIGPNHRCL